MKSIRHGVKGLTRRLIVWQLFLMGLVTRNLLNIPVSIALLVILTGCDGGTVLPAGTPRLTVIPEPTDAPSPTPATLVPSADRWGIYTLDLATQRVEQLYSSPLEISALRLNSVGDRFVFSAASGGSTNKHEEIFTVGIDGQGLQRLTDNAFRDIYPAWSPEGSEIAFLSWRDANLDIYVMNADGGNERRLYDSGFHDADIHWVGDQIAFTGNSRIWIMEDDGTRARQLTDPPRAGEWGKANLPFGDYDPRISPDGTRVVFERLVGDESPHGNYDLYVVGIDGTDLVRLTDTGYAQGLASWSHSGDQLVYIVAAIDDVGQYDVYTVNADGTENRNVTPDTFPPRFLCRWAIFSQDDSTIYFVGEWWSEE